MEFCTVYYLERNDGIQEEELMNWVSVIPDTKRNRMKNSAIYPSQRERILAYMLLQYGLIREYNLFYTPLIEKGEYGKPYFRDRGDICFNISHCRAAVACGLSSDDIGVDVQHIAPYKEKTAAYFMTEEELKGCPENEKDLYFTRLWSLKESYVKYQGHGIFQPDRLHQISVKEGSDPRGFQISSFAMDGYYMAVCGNMEPCIKKVSYEELKEQFSLSFPKKL